MKRQRTCRDSFRGRFDDQAAIIETHCPTPLAPAFMRPMNPSNEELPETIIKHFADIVEATPRSVFLEQAPRFRMSSPRVGDATRIVFKVACIVFFLFSATSCSLLFEAGQIASRSSRSIEKGTRVQGPGVTVLTPDHRMFVQKNKPTRGAVNLKYVDPMRESSSFFAARLPYQGSLEGTFDHANQRAIQRGLHPKYLVRKQTIFKGCPAFYVEQVLQDSPWENVSTTPRFQMLTCHYVVQQGAEPLVLGAGREVFSLPGTSSGLDGGSGDFHQFRAAFAEWSSSVQFK